MNCSTIGKRVLLELGRGEAGDFLEYHREIGTRVEAHTLGDMLYGVLAEPIGVEQTRAGLLDAVFVEQSPEVFSQCLVDHLRNLFIRTADLVGQLLKRELGIGDQFGVLHHLDNLVGNPAAFGGSETGGGILIGRDARILIAQLTLPLFGLYQLHILAV